MFRGAAPLLILCALVGACGGGGGGSGSEADAVRDTLRTFAQATVDGDGEKVCDQFTAATRKQIDAAGQSCAKVFETFATQYKSQAKQQLDAVDDLKISVDGDTAKASRKGGQALTLEKEDGAWKVAVAPR